MFADTESDVNSQNTTAWLAIECEDRSGILADVASTIATFGGNIDVRFLLGMTRLLSILTVHLSMNAHVSFSSVSSLDFLRLCFFPQLPTSLHKSVQV